ncbi:MAG TPA: metallophosphoesterase [Bryobacteraceae bacterium]|nr:metallophosphoesterase [Bryobacteraceae bacterium]
MSQIERLHSPDYVIAAVIVASQYLVGHFVFNDGKPRFSKPTFRAALSALIVMWVITLLGLLLNLLPVEITRRVPAGPHAFLSAAEILWGFTSSFTVAIYIAGRYLIRGLPRGSSESRRRWMKAAAGAAMTAPVAATAFGALVERTRFRVKEVDFPVPNLHPDFEGLRVAQVSDLHVSPYLSVREAARAVDMANELNPHLTLVTGDLISEAGDPLDATIAELSRLRADLGVLGCLGNHEAYAACENYAAAGCKRVGIDMLRGEARQLRRGSGALNIAGVDFQSFRKRDRYLAGADRIVVPGMANLLMSHNPDVFPVAVRQGYDAVIAGHTHGGQVTVEILNQTLNVVRFFTPYVAGLYRLNGRSCYVTAGIGTIGMPVRLGAPPEITLLKLRRA